MLIFDRFKNCRVELLDSETMKVTSTMCDSYHEISVTLKVNISDSVILDAKAEFLRQPNIICKETADFMDRIVGISLTKGITKQANALIGGTAGCTHVVDLVIESAKVFIQGKYTKQFLDISDKDTAMGIINKQLEGTCWYHNRHAREGAEKDK